MLLRILAHRALAGKPVFWADAFASSLAATSRCIPLASEPVTWDGLFYAVTEPIGVCRFWSSLCLALAISLMQ